MKTALFGRKRIRYLFAAIVCVYVLSFFMMPKKGFFICDAGVKYIQMQSMIRHHYRDVSIDIPSLKIINSYAHAPTAVPFFAQKGKKIYSVFSYLFVFISSLFYLMLGFKGLYIFPLLSACALLPAVWNIAGLMRNKTLVQPLVVLMSALCTPLWAYSVQFWELMPATTLVVWAIWFLLRNYSEPGNSNLVYCGACIAVSSYLRDEFLVLAPIIAVVMLIVDPKAWKQVIIFGAATTLSMVPLWIFNWKALGHPLGLHVTSLSASEEGWGIYLIKRLKIVQRLLLNSCKNKPFSVALNIPFLALLLIYPSISKKTARYIAIGLGILSVVNGLVLLWNYLFGELPCMALGHSNGLFGVAPVICFGLIRLRTAAKSAYPQLHVHKQLRHIILLFILLYLLLCPYEHAKGIHWGCRYFLPVYPLLCILSASFMVSMRKDKAVRYVAITSLLVSFVIQVYGINMLYHRKKIIETINQRVLSYPQQMVALTSFFNAMDLAPIFYEKTLFLVQKKDTSRFLQKFRKIGINNILIVILPETREDLAGDVELINNKYHLPVVLKSVPLLRRPR